MPRAKQRACLELSSIREALAELERLGVVAKTGEMRNGRPVFAVTEFSEKLREQYPNGGLLGGCLCPGAPKENMSVRLRFRE